MQRAEGGDYTAGPEKCWKNGQRLGNI